VHAREKASVEVTDLGVDPAHRQHGIGKLLLASAARTGLQSGKSKVTLAAQDAGSGRLTQWYKGIGFTRHSPDSRRFRGQHHGSDCLGNGKSPSPRAKGDRSRWLTDPNADTR
jgi:ribosomal protein S18 acetylase RimI-like enzyme